jgi:hypothetical protein
MSKVLWHTMTIKVPSDMVEITKTGKVSIKKTLTKMNNISKSNGYPSIKLVSSSDNKPHIIADGKEWNINQLKTNLKKANELATKNKGRVFKKKIVQPLKDNNFIENIKTNIKINKSIKATENKTKKLRELYNLFFTYDNSSLKEAMFNVADNMNITLMKDAYTKSTKHNLTTKDIARNVYNKNIPIDLINDEYKKVASKGNNKPYEPIKVRGSRRGMSQNSNKTKEDKQIEKRLDKEKQQNIKSIEESIKQYDKEDFFNMMMKLADKYNDEQLKKTAYNYVSKMITPNKLARILYEFSIPIEKIINST